MNLKIIITKRKKADRTIFRFLALVVMLWLTVSFVAPVRFEKIIVKNPPASWQVAIEGDDEIMVRDYFLKISERRRMTITAYSSTVDQTDSTPFITASNARVRDGIIACNFLEFGTRILIPEEFGYNKVFAVEDRMARRFKNRIDIWFKTRKAAKKFGKKELKIIVLTN